MAYLFNWHTGKLDLVTGVGDPLVGGTANRFVTTDSSGNIVTDSDYRADGLNMGLSVDPISRIHIDSGIATASDIKFTAGSTTGQTASDGFSLGISSAGNGLLKQFENLPIDFYTNNLIRARLTGTDAGADGRFVVGDTADTYSLLPTTDTKFSANTLITSLGSSFSPLDVVKICGQFAAVVSPVADTDTGTIPVVTYSSGGASLRLTGSNKFNAGLTVGSTLNGNISGFGIFGHVSVDSSNTVDGVVGVFFTALHTGVGSATTKIIGGAFEVLTDDSLSPGSPTGSLDEAYAGTFVIGRSAVQITTAASGRFYEPRTYDSGNGFGTPTDAPTNRTAAWVDGTLTITESEVSSTASITEMSVDTSRVLITGSTATTLHGIHSDSFSKVVFLRNESTASITIPNESGTATAANRILTPSGETQVIAPFESAIFWHDKDAARWRLEFQSINTRFIETVSGTTTLDSTYGTVLCDANLGAFTVNLPAAASYKGFLYVIKKIDSSATTVTVDGNGAETIDGAGTYALPVQYSSVQIQSNGSAWYII